MVLILECGVVPLLLRSRSFPVRCPENICRSEEHTSELQSQSNLVCRLLLEKKKKRHALALTAILPTITTSIPHLFCVVLLAIRPRVIYHLYAANVIPVSLNDRSIRIS